MTFSTRLPTADYATFYSRVLPSLISARRYSPENKPYHTGTFEFLIGEQDSDMYQFRPEGHAIPQSRCCIALQKYTYALQKCDAFSVPYITLRNNLCAKCSQGVGMNVLDDDFDMDR